MLRVSVALCLVAAVLGGPPVSKSRAEIEEFRNYLESTRIDQGVVVPASPEKTIWSQSGKYQGDILLDEDQIEDMVEQYASGRNAYIVAGTRWPNNVVFYQFAAGHFNQAQTNWILQAMRLIESRTCIRFQQRTNQANYALITGNTNGCYANVGYSARRGVHTMNVARNDPGRGCLNQVIIVHEWLHVLGFFHMQSTHNRDSFVRINWANIVRGMEHNFDRYGTNTVSNLNLPYELGSCMHYGPFDFSANGRTTIDSLTGSNAGMGQTVRVTDNDWLRVDRHYGCRPWDTPNDDVDTPLDPVAEVVLPQEEVASPVQVVDDLRL